MKIFLRKLLIVGLLSLNAFVFASTSYVFDNIASDTNLLKDIHNELLNNNISKFDSVKNVDAFLNSLKEASAKILSQIKEKLTTLDKLKSVSSGEVQDGYSSDYEHAEAYLRAAETNVNSINKEVRRLAKENESASRKLERARYKKGNKQAADRIDGIEEEKQSVLQDKLNQHIEEGETVLEFANQEYQELKDAPARDDAPSFDEFAERFEALQVKAREEQLTDQELQSVGKKVVRERPELQSVETHALGKVSQPELQVVDSGTLVEAPRGEAVWEDPTAYKTLEKKFRELDKVQEQLVDADETLLRHEPERIDPGAEDFWELAQAKLEALKASSAVSNEPERSGGEPISVFSGGEGGSGTTFDPLDPDGYASGRDTPLGGNGDDPGEGYTGQDVF